MKSLTLRFDTTDFEFSHGRTPRGRGGWLFAFVRDFDVATDRLVNANGTFAEAKKELKAKLLAEGMTGHVTVFVCS